MTSAEHEELYIRIFNFADRYESKGFQERLNVEAKSYLKSRGIEVRIMPAPQGAGSSIASISLGLRVLKFLMRVIPLIRNYTNKIYEDIVDNHMRSFTIWLDTHNNQEYAARNTSLNSELLMIGYDLKIHLEEVYQNYVFKVQISITDELDGQMLQVCIEKVNPTKSDIGRLLKYVEQKPTGNHSVVHIILGSDSKIRYSYYDK